MRQQAGIWAATDRGSADSQPQQYNYALRLVCDTAALLKQCADDALLIFELNKTIKQSDI